MFKIIAASLVLAITAQAYLVESPGNGSGWVSNGDNTVTWSRVDTDAETFDLILSNVNRQEFPQFTETLISDVDGTTGSLTFNADGLPTGVHFRVNLNVAGSGANGGIYAQSNEFTISSSGGDGGEGTDTATDTTTATDSTDTSTPTGTDSGAATVTSVITETVSEGVTTTFTGLTTTTETDATTTTEFSTSTEDAATVTESDTTTTTTTVTETSTPVRKARRTESPKWVGKH